MQIVRKWLAPYSWPQVIDFNRGLCAAKSALHKPTSDGHDETKKIWEAAQSREMTLEEALQICLICHRTAPFCFFNGNTFVVIARDFIRPVLDELAALDLATAATFRSVVGHFVAGTEGLEELRRAIKEALAQINSEA